MTKDGTRNVKYLNKNIIASDEIHICRRCRTYFTCCGKSWEHLKKNQCVCVVDDFGNIYCSETCFNKKRE